MVDLRTILDSHRGKQLSHADIDVNNPEKSLVPTQVEIPTVFFDDVLVNYKFNRVEIMVLVYLYRQVYCCKNVFKDHGISKLISHTEMVNSLNLSIEDIHNVVKKLEDLGFLETIRLGQYFVRKYFTKDLDKMYGHSYQDFES